MKSFLEDKNIYSEDFLQSRSNQNFENQNVVLPIENNNTQFSLSVLNKNLDQLSKTKKKKFFNNFYLDFNNLNLLKCKLFYFFFYAAFGSLFPLVAIYFKNLALNPTQVGILIGIRPLIEIFTAPFWLNLAEKFNKIKLILIASLFSWIIFTSSIATIKTPTKACISFNGSNFILYLPQFEDKIDNYNKIVSLRNKRSTNLKFNFYNSLLNYKIFYFKSGLAHYSIFKHKQKNSLNEHLNKKDPNNEFIFKLNPLFRLPSNHVIGKSPFKIHFISNYKENLDTNLVSPAFSHVVYKANEVNEVFFLLFLIIIIGEIFSSPAITLVDAITIRYLGDNINNYNKQRIFGSFGWSISILIVCILLDDSTKFENLECGSYIQNFNYSLCFKVFIFFMLCCCIVAYKFSLEFSNEKSIKNQIEMNFNKPENYKLKSKIPKLTTKLTTESNNKFVKNKCSQETKTYLNLKLILKSLTNFKVIFLFVLAWFMGTGVGLVFSFLFWHLQDLGGTSTLFGIASLINHVSENIAYFFILNFIKKYGFIRILYLGLACNFIRFLYTSYIDNAWLILPFELIHGLTQATVWPTLCSILNQFTQNENSQLNYQVIIQFAYTGLGKGLGSILGGMIINLYGTKFAFAIYAFASLFFLIISFIVMTVIKVQLVVSDKHNFQNKSKHINEIQIENLNANLYVTSCLPYGVPIASFKQTPIRIQSEFNINCNKEIKNNELNSPEQPDSGNVILNKSFRDWRITLNKNQNVD